MNFKKIIALSLSIVSIFAMLACKAEQVVKESSNQEIDLSEYGQTYSGGDGGENGETAKPTPTPDPRDAMYSAIYTDAPPDLSNEQIIESITEDVVNGNFDKVTGAADPNNNPLLGPIIDITKQANGSEVLDKLQEDVENGNIDPWLKEVDDSANYDATHSGDFADIPDVDFENIPSGMRGLDELYESAAEGLFNAMKDSGVSAWSNPEALAKYQEGAQQAAGALGLKPNNYENPKLPRVYNPGEYKYYKNNKLFFIDLAE